MADAITIEVKGMAELAKNLREIPAQLSTKVMRGALHAAGDVIANAAEATAPVRTGQLREDIVTKVYVSGDLSFNSVRVGPGYDRNKLPVRKRGAHAGRADTSASPGVYGKFLEFGTRHMAARPWLRPAFELSKEEAVNVFISYIRAGLQAIATALRS